MNKHCIINGPNLNLLGQREPEIYGSMTLSEIQKHTESELKKRGLDVKLDWFQSNIEGEIVEKIQSTLEQNYKSIIINPAGYSHTSVAIYDALKLVKIPIVEVHLSNVYAREDFRHNLLTARAARTIMSGLGKNAYAMAVLSQEL
ncbi:MAG: type II 3-dehydroquinate dehydratase [Bacteriovoracaceae bacterium]|nr:type II 3-dehydroquinate dehydratase [Bacteriovoracaceae bacterium]